VVVNFIQVILFYLRKTTHKYLEGTMKWFDSLHPSFFLQSFHQGW